MCVGVNEMDAKNKELVFVTVHCIIAIVAALLMIKGHISMYVLLFLAVVLFFCSGAGEGIKTILGTIYLLLYVIGILAYYLYVSIFLSFIVI